MHPVDPWVPIVPGVPITSLSREGDDVRAFSPGRSHYVLAASGIDYGSPQQGDAWGLLVVDIASGTASEIRVDRHRFRFAEPDDIEPPGSTTTSCGGATRPAANDWSRAIASRHGPGARACDRWAPTRGSSTFRASTTRSSPY